MAVNYGWTKSTGTTISSYEVDADNFKLLEDEPGKTVYVENTETAIDQKEKITITSNSIPTVANGLEIVHPNRVSNGWTFAIKVEETGRYTDTVFGTVDDPVVVQLSVRSALDAEVTKNSVDDAIGRLLGVLYPDDTTGHLQDTIARLMRGSTKLLG